MAKTLLNGVNEVLKAAKLIQGDSGELTSLTDSPRQVWVDSAVQIWNETMEELYSTAEIPMPNELGEDTITLVTGDRDYALVAFNTLYFPFVNETTGQYIYEWTSGYLNLVATQPIPSDWTGLPLYGAIRPTDRQLYLDRLPTSDENGLVYKYRYDKDVSVSAKDDTFPFTDTVFRALVPAVTEKFNVKHFGQFNGGLFRESIGRAARELSGQPARSHYRRTGQTTVGGIFAPFDS